MKQLFWCTIVLFSIGFTFQLFAQPSESDQSAYNMANIIPAPQSFKLKHDQFILNHKTTIFGNFRNKQIRNITEYLQKQVLYLTGNSITINSDNLLRNVIILNVIPSNNSREAYSLSVRKNSVVITGSDSAGLFYGVQSFLQLLYPLNKNGNEIIIPGIEINDKPVYKWRGMHLDVCRHFYSTDFIKKMIDMLAIHKMNTFHWHLTDDQGWRIEIKKYPKLTEIGAWRKETLIGHMKDAPLKSDGIKYGGYYTQEQIRDIVEYAKKRYVTIIPEIEMPGHAIAALAAYPQFSCTGGPFDVYTKWGISEEAFCAGNDSVFSFIGNILSEVIDLFPGQYIHIGGDECLKNRWQSCTKCQNRIKAEGLKNETELQSFFIKRIEKFISSRGKKMIGWDEILEGGLPERASIMSWRGYRGGFEAAHAGHDVVMTPTSFCYFDYYQALLNEPLAIDGYVPLEKVYAFNPVPEGLTKTEEKHILGAQANVWTEYMPTESHTEYMIFPRLCALSEVLWTQQKLHDYTGFLVRMEKHTQRLKKYQVNYRPLK